MIVYFLIQYLQKQLLSNIACWVLDMAADIQVRAGSSNSEELETLTASGTVLGRRHSTDTVWYYGSEDPLVKGGHVAEPSNLMGKRGEYPPLLCPCLLPLCTLHKGGSGGAQLPRRCDSSLVVGRACLNKENRLSPRREPGPPPLFPVHQRGSGAS